MEKGHAVRVQEEEEGAEKGGPPSASLAQQQASPVKVDHFSKSELHEFC